MLFYNNLIINYYRILNTGGGIRTHEANAWDLESHPFDRSGTPVPFMTLQPGLEPGTLRLTASRSNQLSYWSILIYEIKSLNKNL